MRAGDIKQGMTILRGTHAVTVTNVETESLRGDNDTLVLLIRIEWFAGRNRYTLQLPDDEIQTVP